MKGEGDLDWQIGDLRPTQMTVGFSEVARKRHRWRSETILPGTPSWARQTPVALGPDSVAYALDRHHALCALFAEGVTRVPVVIAEDLSHLDEETFWRELMTRGWCYPFDAQGVQHSWRAIPRRFGDLADDPFRSLASALRRSGGYDKTDGLFSEFRWAAYLRNHLSPDALESDFPGALRAARSLAAQPAARALPGWRDTAQRTLRPNAVACPA